MLNKIANLVNYIRVRRHSLFREFEFYYDPPPKKISEVQNYQLKSEIVKEILKFYTNCGYFYENLKISKELKIEGAWKNFMLNIKKEQIDNLQKKKCG